MTAGSASAQKRLNVLFISVDDLRPALGCYGNPIVKSPNIDRLASEGVRFERAYCQYPLCNPSRASMLTGRYPTTTGVTDNLANFRDTLPDVVTLPEQFRKNGYVTARTGKIFHGGIDDARSWTEGGERGAARRPRTQGDRDSYRRQSDRFEAVKGDGERLADYRTAGSAVRLLEKHRDQPFFIAVGFLKPHTPFVAPEKYFKQYEGVDIPLPPDFRPRAAPAEGAPDRSLGPNGDLFINRDASPEEAKQMIRAYYAAVSFIDDQVGRVMAAVDRLGLRDNTVVVFWGDHGFHLGEKGKWSKHSSLYEPALRIPLILRSPGCRSGLPSPRTVQLMDIYPTLTGLCGLDQPAGLEGRSLQPLLMNPSAEWDHPALSYARLPIGLGRSIRTERYRYTEWKEGEAGVELYDYETDPHELRNLAAEAEKAGAVRRLSERMKQMTAPR